MSKICKHCNHENDSDRQKCAYCGELLSIKTITRYRQASLGFALICMVSFSILTVYHGLIHSPLFVSVLGAFVVSTFLLIMSFYAMIVEGETNE